MAAQFSLSISKIDDRVKINVEPGVKGIVVTAISKTPAFNDWTLIISDVCTEENEDMMYCYACVGLKTDRSMADDARKRPIRFGHTSNYNFFKPTEQELMKLKSLLNLYELKFVKGINKMFDR